MKGCGDEGVRRLRGWGGEGVEELGDTAELLVCLKL